MLIEVEKCSVDGCENPIRANGLCPKHHQRWLRHGDPTVNLKPQHITHPSGGDGCSVEGCDGEFHCHGFCYKHYGRWKRHGDPTYNKTEAAIRYLTEVVLTHEDKSDCLIWPFKSRGGKGYALMTLNGERQYVHRVVCERIHGTPPSPFHQATHSCGNGHLACINPHHVRWGTAEENAEDMLRHGTGKNQYGSFQKR